MELVGMARACEDILRNREKERILGRTEEKRYIIRKMLENGESIEKIQLYSNCSIKLINKIKNELL